MATIALILCTFMVAVLLGLEGKRNPDASRALWVPTIWVLICASRPIERWFDYAVISSGEGIEAGSAVDRWVLEILLVVAVLILIRRRVEWSRILQDNLWLILVFLYMAISILWSEIPFVSFKRWFRSTGDIIIALVILSERMPLRSLESVFRRCAYVLIPFSLVLVKYFPHLGRAYGRWSGLETWIGVTVQKNCLGELCAFSIFLLIWAFLREWRSGGLFKNTFQTLADALILAIAFRLLKGPGGSYSATSIGVFIVGTAVLLLLYRRENLARYVARHLKILGLSLTLTFLFFYDELVQIVAPIFGREETLTGRTDIWAPVFDFASRSPVFGTGYGGFFAPENEELVNLFSPQFILTQAHNGYLAVYVELGIIGLVLLAVFLLAYCNKVRRELNHAFEWGVLGICFLAMLLLYNNSEVCFLSSPNYFWSIMVFLTVVFSESCLHKNGV